MPAKTRLLDRSKGAGACPAFRRLGPAIVAATLGLTSLGCRSGFEVSALGLGARVQSAYMIPYDETPSTPATFPTVTSDSETIFETVSVTEESKSPPKPPSVKVEIADGS